MTRWRFLRGIGKALIASTSVAFLLLVWSVWLLEMLVHGPGLAAEYKEEETRVLLIRLKDSKHSLADGIRQAEKEEGFAISAKFEMEGDELSLSVYTAKQGRDVDAEHNTLMELAGNPTRDQWEPKKEVFEDKPHIARASMHLTLMQVTKLTLEDVIKKAAAHHPGTVYSVTPAIHNGKPVSDVLVATPDGKSVHLTVDLRTGKVIK